MTSELKQDGVGEETKFYVPVLVFGQWPIKDHYYYY